MHPAVSLLHRCSEFCWLELGGCVHRTADEANLNFRCELAPMKQSVLSQPQHASRVIAQWGRPRAGRATRLGIYCMGLRCKMIDKRMWASQTPLRHFKAGRARFVACSMISVSPMFKLGKPCSANLLPRISWLGDMCRCNCASNPWTPFHVACSATHDAAAQWPGCHAT